MNFKNNWKRFWTLSKSHEGFTLVELIVVIAIMAILAGVAVPAYSGYINKANKAADLQLLGAINTAFSAAVMDRDNKSAAELPDGSITFNVDTMLPSDYVDEFKIYFAGNTGKFQVIEDLRFVGGVFKDRDSLTSADGYSQYTYTDSNGNTHTFYISSEGAAALAGSIYGIEMGADGMLDRVDYVTTLAAELMSVNGSTAFADMVAGPDAGEKLAEMLGIDMSTEEGQQEFMNAVGGMLNDKMDVLVAANPGKYDTNDREEGSDLYNDALHQLYANNAVLNAAQSSASASTDILSILGGEDSSGKILTTITSDSSTGLSQAAMAYGLYTAYATKNGLTVSDNPGEVLNKLDSDQGFKDYINDVNGSGQAQKDLEGYLAAMDMINTNVGGNSAAVSDLLVNGFANDSLVDLLDQAMKG